jgi:hypothetical protein
MKCDLCKKKIEVIDFRSGIVGIYDHILHNECFELIKNIKPVLQLELL